MAAFLARHPDVAAHLAEGENELIGGAVMTGLAWVDVPCPDSTGPSVTNVQAVPNPASTNDLIVLSAKVDDSGAGDSTIVSADYEIRDGDGAVVLSGAGDNSNCPSPIFLCPEDGSGIPDTGPTPFAAVIEFVQVTIPGGNLSVGVHDACVRGTDAFGNTGAFECAMLVIFDPDGGFVTGGGWIQSEPGFCSLNAACAAAEGTANFGFVSKYKRGANVPTGLSFSSAPATSISTAQSTTGWWLPDRWRSSRAPARSTVADHGLNSRYHSAAGIDQSCMNSATGVVSRRR